VWAAAENSIAAAQKQGDDTTECGAVIGGLENDGTTTYYVWIKAKNAGGTSAPSEAGSATMRVDTLHLDAYLRALAANTPETPHTVRLAASTIINTEDTSELGVWASINILVRDAERYVTLDLSDCSAAGNTVTGANEYTTPTANKLNIVKDNAYIKGVVLPQTLTSIGIYAFYQCALLSSVTMQDKVTRIGEVAFSGCAGLTEMTIPSSVTRIDSNAFSNCGNLVRVTFAAGSAINSSNFSYTSSFPGNLRDQYFSETGGGAGTYLREAGASTWTNMASPPPGVTATAQSLNSILVSWDTVPWAQSYRIYRGSASSGGTYSLAGTAEKDAQSYLDSGLSANTTYLYAVSIVSDVGEGRRSTSSSATTKVPAVPANVSAVNISTNSISLSWDAVPAAVSYKVYRAESAEGTYSPIASPTDTSYSDAELPADTAYHYKVCAVNAVGEGSPAYVSAKTLLYNIGDTGPAGGLIFYADATGFVSAGVTYHYMEAAPEDLSGTYQWGGYGTSCSTETAIGTGAANTAALTASDHGHPHPAAQACAEYEYDSYDDWFLPSTNEWDCNSMWNRLSVKGNYWSSSGASTTYAWYQYIGDYGAQPIATKQSELRVRAVRAF
jgi:hypothetical protein